MDKIIARLKVVVTDETVTDRPNTKEFFCDVKGKNGQLYIAGVNTKLSNRFQTCSGEYQMPFTELNTLFGINCGRTTTIDTLVSCDRHLLMDVESIFYASQQRLLKCLPSDIRFNASLERGTIVQAEVYNGAAEMIYECFVEDDIDKLSLLIGSIAGQNIPLEGVLVSLRDKLRTTTN